MTEKHGTDKIQDTLMERRLQHGPFAKHCHIEISLRNVLNHYNKGDLGTIQEIGLGMIIHKIARILNGGNSHSDTWHDIAGYATLVEQSILDEQVE